MPYVDLNTIHNPATGTIAPATWGDQARDNLEFLIDPPGCSVFHSVVQSVATAASTAMNADSETFDNDAMHSTVTNNSRITATTPGRYLLVATVEFDNNNTGYRSSGFFVNGVFSPLGGQTVQAAQAQVTRLTATRTLVMAAGDYAQVQVQQTSGGNLNVTLREFAALFLTR